jgi:integrase/recombinase XerC
MFYRWCASRAAGRLLDDNPAEELPIGQAVRLPPSPIGTDELYAALTCAKTADPRMYAWLMLAASVGLRCVEIAQVDARSVRWNEDRTVLITIRRKGGKVRTVLGGPGVYEALLPWRNQPGPWWTVRDSGTGRDVAISAKRVSNYVAKFLREQMGIGENASAHKLRHWFGTTSWTQRRDLRATQDAMGHANPTQTAQYIAVLQGDGDGITLDVDRAIRGRARPGQRIEARP